MVYYFFVKKFILWKSFPCNKFIFSAPEAPSDVRYNCLANCDLIWKAPNDFGSPITAYKLFIREMKNKEEVYDIKLWYEWKWNRKCSIIVLFEDKVPTSCFKKEYVDEGQMIQLHSNDLKIDLSFLKPLSIYEVKLLAVNSVGESSAYSLILDTPGLIFPFIFRFIYNVCSEEILFFFISLKVLL